MITDTNPLTETPAPPGKVYRFFWIALFFWGFLGYPLSSFVSQFSGSESNEISIATRVLFVLIAATTIFLAVSSRHLYLSRGWLACYLIYWAMYAARLTYDCMTYPNQLSRPVTDYLFFGMLVCCFGSLAFLAIPDEVILKKCRLWFLGGLVLINLLSLFNNIVVGGISLIDLTGSYVRFSANDRLNTITYGFLGASLLVQSFNLLARRSLTFYGSKAVLIGFIVLGALTTLLAGSRSPTIGAALGVLIVTSRLMRKGRLVTFLGIGVAVMIFSYYVFTLAPTLFESISTRFIGVHERDDSTYERITAYEGAWKQFLESPFLGDFIEERATNQYPHNPFLESLMSIGILGGALYLIIFFVTLSRAISLWPHDESGWLVLLFVQTIVTGFVSGSIGFDSNFWYTVVIINVVYSRGRYWNSEKPPDALPQTPLIPSQSNAPS